MNSVSSSRLPLSFWALNLSQFLSAFNDNIFRWVVAWALATRAASSSGAIDEKPFFIAAVLFALPYILFSSAAGVLADRYSKRAMLLLWNLAAVLVMLFGMFAFYSNQPPLIYLALFLIATQSAFFSPNKYGILAEILRREDLSRANGYIESAVDLGIILGTFAGGWTFARFGHDIPGASTLPCWRAGALCTGIAVAGTLLCFLIPDTGARSSGKALTPWFWKDVARNLASVRSNRYLYLTLFAIGFFYFIGAFTQINVAPYGTEVLGLSKPQATNLFLALALGIGFGAFCAGRLSRRSAEIGLVPVGVLIMSAVSALFLIPNPHVFIAVPLLVLFGIGGGFYIVPLNTYLQDAAPEDSRGELIGTANFLQFCGMFAAAFFLMALQALKVGPGVRFAILGGITLAVALVVLKVLPDFFLRFIGLIMTRVVYRLETLGVESVPYFGGALLVCNHVSYADAVLLGATHQRRIRFVMDRDIYNSWPLGFIFRLMRCIPVSQDDSPRNTVRALREARQALDEGYLVCIFAEGSLTRTGYIMEFKRGLEHIVKGSNHPIIPVCMHGIWGSILSYSHGKVLGRMPRPLRRGITVLFGDPLPADSNAFEVRQAVMELQARLFERDRANHKPLPQEFVRIARANWSRFCIADTTGKTLTYGRALTGATALAEALRVELIGQDCVGLLLPSSAGGALANIAVMLLSRVPVNLNYTASREAVAAAIQQARISRIITSRSFMERFGQFKSLEGLLYLEDIFRLITRSDKMRAYVRARFSPALWLLDKREFNAAFPLPDKEDSARRPLRRRPTVEDSAVILFSSGSTGNPKGVLLSHYNIFSNAQAIQQIFRIAPDDVILGVLPFFHSFGLTVTLWLPLLSGCGVAYHFNPTESERVAKLCAKHRCTLLAATPTFLQTYARKVTPEHFSTLTRVIAGAEKLKPGVIEAFRARFGVTPMEGYGATELSPVASVNVPNFEEGGVRQVANQPGSIGRPLPGVVMKVVDPDDFSRDLGYEREGLLLVKGPNVMQGYLCMPEQTAEVIRDGWYVTGDIARIEHDGFVTITDRLSRFSKIGGEMVPHQLIEDKLQELLGKTEPVCSVTALPDEKKGERIIVLLTPEAGDPARAARLLRESGLPNLWVPAPRNYFVIDAIPLLGSGKTDLKALRLIAERLSRETPDE